MRDRARFALDRRRCGKTPGAQLGNAQLAEQLATRVARGRLDHRALEKSDRCCRGAARDRVARRVAEGMDRPAVAGRVDVEQVRGDLVGVSAPVRKDAGRARVALCSPYTASRMTGWTNSSGLPGRRIAAAASASTAAEARSSSSPASAATCPSGAAVPSTAAAFTIAWASAGRRVRRTRTASET
ncbi:MAG: hypothetical protein M3025_00440, partial [Actinomycetota bacterium]|nr:hypothetical protein [Actinomycetota bacterium]